MFNSARSMIMGFRLLCAFALIVALPVRADRTTREDLRAKTCAARLVREQLFFDLKADGFNTFRGLAEYIENTPAEVVEALISAHHIIEGGAGDVRFGEGFLGATLEDIEHLKALVGERELIDPKAFADGRFKLLFDFMENVPYSERPIFTAVSFKTTRTEIPDPIRAPSIGDRLRIFNKGEFFEKISNERLLGGVGPADVILDVAGVASYSDRIDIVLKKYLATLANDGVIYIYAGPETAGNPMLNSRVKLLSGRTIPLVDWIRRQSGIKLELLRVKPTVTYRNTRLTLKITKVPGEKFSPLALLQTQSDFGSPPERRFEEQKPKP